jgi:hypothetical protein
MKRTPMLTCSVMGMNQKKSLVRIIEEDGGGDWPPPVIENENRYVDAKRLTFSCKWQILRPKLSVSYYVHIDSTKVV